MIYCRLLNFTLCFVIGVSSLLFSSSFLLSLVLPVAIRAEAAVLCGGRIPSGVRRTRSGYFHRRSEISGGVSREEEGDSKVLLGIDPEGEQDGVRQLVVCTRFR